MKRLLIVLFAGALFMAGCQVREGEPVAGASAVAPKAAAVEVQNPVERGKYLVTIGHCNDCHTPFKVGPNGPEPDMALELSGHPEKMVLPEPPKPNGPWIWSSIGTNTAFAGPWGVSFTANLTPDPNTGIGIWTEDQFMKSMRTGKHWGVGRPIMPPMPWQNVAAMSDADLKAVFAYLRSIKPIVNHVPDYQPPPEPPTAG